MSIFGWLTSCWRGDPTTSPEPINGGDVFLTGGISAGDGGDEPGYSLTIRGGQGLNGGSGGNVHLGPGTYRAGNGGPGGQGGDLNICGGDAN